MQFDQALRIISGRYPEGNMIGGRHKHNPLSFVLIMGLLVLGLMLRSWVVQYSFNSVMPSLNAKYIGNDSMPMLEFRESLLLVILLQMLFN